jgi:predicted dehydrogenase
VALVGAGFWARHAHLPALLAQDDVTVVGVVDPVVERAQAMAVEHGIPYVGTTLPGLIVAQQPDLLVIAAPTAAHADLVTQALESGVAVLCEKPLAHSLHAAAHLVALVEATPVPCSVGYAFRYAPALQALKRDVDRGALGEPWLLELFEYNAQFHPANHKLPGWKGDPAQVQAGALLEYGSHIIDLAAWLAGPITGVQCALAEVLPGAQVDDIATLQLRFGAPAIGVLVAGWVLSGSSPGITVRFHGKEGLAEACLSEALPGGQAYRRFSLAGVAEEVAIEPVDHPAWEYARRQSADLVRLLRGEGPFYAATLPSLRDGLAVQQVIEAALAAADRWTPVAGAPGSKLA